MRVNDSCVRERKTPCGLFRCLPSDLPLSPCCPSRALLTDPVISDVHRKKHRITHHYPSENPGTWVRNVLILCAIFFCFFVFVRLMNPFTDVNSLTTCVCLRAQKDCSIAFLRHVLKICVLTPYPRLLLNSTEHAILTIERNCGVKLSWDHPQPWMVIIPGMMGGPCHCLHGHNSCEESLDLNIRENIAAWSTLSFLCASCLL
jgi:hypothetical protein